MKLTCSFSKAVNFIFSYSWTLRSPIFYTHGGEQMNKYKFIYRAADALLGAVTGYLYGGTLSSKVGFRGIAKKVMLFFVVAVAHLCDQAVGG
jgi:phage-related holin